MRVLGRAVRLADPTLQYDDDALVGRSGAFTAVRLPAQPFAFTAAADRKRAVRAATLALASLQQGRVVIKAVHAPTAVGAWAGAVDAAVQSRSVPAGGWAQYLAGAQERVAAVAPTEKQVFLLAGLGSRPVADQVAWRREPDAEVPAWFRRRPNPLAPLSARERARWAQRAAGVRSRLARGALAGAPVGAEQLRALRRYGATRCTAVSASASGRRMWGPGELVSEFADVQVVPGPRWVRVTSEAGEVFSATFVCSAFPVSMDFPATDPWLAHLDRVEGFTVDSDLVLDLVPSRRAKADVALRGKVAADQAQDAARAQMEAPLEVAQMLDLARRLEHALPSQRWPMAYGWARLRVDGASPSELRDKFEVVREHMGALGGAGVDVAWPGGASQVDLWSEGIAGLPVRHRSWRQRWLLETAAAAGQFFGGAVGHATGAYRGFATGRVRSAVRVDLHAPILARGGGAVEQPGGVVLLGAQRSGKSAALASMVYDESMAGGVVLELDPSGPQQRVARLEVFAGRAEGFDLVEAGGGIADPLGPVLIPDPPAPVATGERVADQIATSRWNAARAGVRRERETLARETLTTLAWKQVHADADAETALLGAIRDVAARGEGMAAVVAALRAARTKAARNLGAHLDFELGGSEAAALFGSGADVVDRSRITTRVISMRGLAGALPEAGKPIGQWLPSEQLAAATFGCGAYLGRRLLFGMDPDVLKLFVVDEAHVLLASPAGRRVVEVALRDGPKHGVTTVLATHNARDLVDERITAAVSMWFLFRSTAPSELEASFAAARVEDTAAHREIRSTLENGECIAVLDDDSRDRFQWDLWRPDLAMAAVTTPGRHAQSQAAGSPAAVASA